MKKRYLVTQSQYHVFRLFIAVLLVMNFLMISGHDAHAAGDILYADASGLTSGTCNSWVNACDLQYALSVSVSTDEIWVKQGVYKPTAGIDRTISFVLKAGVSLYGGFVGTEILRSQRGTSSSLTIFSGDIGMVNDVTDNSYHVVVASNTTNATVMDGFTITGGYASGAAPNNFGAGMYNDSGNLLINNIVFDLNKAFSADYTVDVAGGGMYNINGSPVFTNVIFSNNSTTQTSAGGACYGGGMYNENSSSVFDNVTFVGNKAETPLLGSCGGAGMYNKNSTLNLTNMIFSNNVGSHMGWPNATLGSAGGGIWNVSSVLTITHALFSDNVAHFGGGIMNSNSSLSLNDAAFNNNIAYYYGGGIITSGIADHNVTVTDTSFDGNSAGLIGGGFLSMYISDSIITLSNITFTGNNAELGGGLGELENTNSTLTLVNSTFKDNSANYIGGGAYIRNGSSILNNLTFTGNTAVAGGGALYNDGASPVISNNIFWGDSSEIINGSENGYGVSAPVIKDSVISTGCPAGATCTNIVTADPKLGALQDNGGLTQTMALGTGSSAIDTGGKNSICATSDQRGTMRPQGSGCDIGAYEFITATVLVNSILPTSRSIPVGTTATIFNTVINAGTSTANGVTLSMAMPPAGTFAYQQTDCVTNAVIGSINPVLDIPAGGVLCYVLSFTPSAAFAATSVHIRAQAVNAPPTNLLTGVNTWLLRSTISPEADIIALTTTTDFHQTACSGANVFAIALANIGEAATGDITVTANTGTAILPLTFAMIFETDPATSGLIGDHILQNVGAGENRTVAVFVIFNGCIPFDPAANRIFVEFRDENNNVVGSTSTAVSTNR